MTFEGREIALSGSALKVIAVVSMTIDHVALYVMADNLGMQDLWLYDVLRGVGRPAFPIFAFLVVEGYLHTHHINNYVMTLLLSAFVSEIPWNLLGQHDSHKCIVYLVAGAYFHFHYGQVSETIMNANYSFL